MNKSLPVLATAILLAGCFGGQTCDRPQRYQQAQPTTPVRAPDGLNNLDETRDLKVPVASTPPGAARDACLEAPPPYSDQMAAIREDD